MAGIYVHIPYCRSFCIYCDFYSELSRGGSSESFVCALKKEAAARLPELGGASVSTIYFGGGTPSLLPAGELAGILSFLKDRTGSPSEVTVEVNPDDVLAMGLDGLETLLEAGFNRVSMGVQSFDDSVLRWMRRRHDAEGAVKACSLLRGAGFTNLSIDLIFGFRGLSSGLWRETLDKAVSLMPEHVSAYQLTVEPGSALARLQESGRYEEVPDEESAAQYAMLQTVLAEAGYEQYEVSNFALPGMYSRHNSSYWHHVPYLGLGPGAHSLSVSRDGRLVRSWNDPDLKGYLAGSCRRGSEVLSAAEVEEERIMLGLRCSAGTALDKTKAAPLVREGLLEEISDGLYRIPAGRLFISEYVIGRLV